MPGGGTTGGGAFRYPHEFATIVQRVRDLLPQDRPDVDEAADEFITFIMDRDRALEDYTTAGNGSILFATVDGSGDGDYTSIKEAIEDVASVATDQNSYAVIFVRPFDNSGNGYDEAGAGEITIAGSPVNVTVWSGSIGSTTDARQNWSTDGFASTNLDGLNLCLVGFDVTVSANHALLNNTVNWSGTPFISIDNCEITVTSATYGLLAPTRTGGRWFITNSIVPWMRHGGNISNSGGFARSMTATFKNSVVSLGSTAGLTTLTHGSSDSSLCDFHFEDCEIRFVNTSAAIAVVGSWSSGRNSNVWRMVNCYQSGLGTGHTNVITLTRMSVLIDGFTTLRDGEGTSPALTLNLVSLNDGSNLLHMGGFCVTNVMHAGLNLTVTDNARTSVQGGEVFPGRISGTLGQLTLDASICSVDVVCTQAVAGTPSIDIDGDYNIVRAAIQYLGAAPGSGPGLVVSGDNNRIEVAVRNLTTPYTDTGSGNIINGTGGPAGGDLDGTYPDPTVQNITALNNFLAKGDLLAATAASTPGVLTVGADGTALRAASGETTGLEWAPPFDVVEAKGDLIVGTADDVVDNLTAGADGTSLEAASGETTGLVWQATRYAEDVGDGMATSFVVTHSLGSRDVLVQVRENATPGDYVTPTNIESTDDDTVTVTFGSAPASDEFRVIVQY